MKFLPACSQTVLVLATLVLLGDVGSASRSAISLNVSRNMKPNGVQGGLEIKCSVDSKAAEFDSVIAITVYGSSPYGRGDDFEELATLDIWSHSPRLVDNLAEAGVSVDGSISSDSDTSPFLALSWRSSTAGSRQTYKCVVKGLYKDGEAAVLSSMVKLEPVSTGSCQEIGAVQTELSGLSDKVEGASNLTEFVLFQVKTLSTKFDIFETNAAAVVGKVFSQFLTLTNHVKDAENKSIEMNAEVSTQIQTLTAQVKETENKSNKMNEQVSTQIQTLTNHVNDAENKSFEMNGEVSTQIQTLTAQVKDLENKCSSVDVSSQIKDLKTGLITVQDKLKSFDKVMISQNRMLGIDKIRFDVSEVYENRVYLVSRTEEPFNIAEANNFCRQSGGYLVELDDADEYQFVFDLVSGIRGANSFWTGGNDIDEEGTFVYYNSKKPVPHLTWVKGQPDNAGGRENCMEIRLNFGGLNDWTCNQSGKYVCEVLLW